eukprot:486054_1
MRHLKQDNTAKAEKIEFLIRQIKSMTKGKKDVYNDRVTDRQRTNKHLTAQIANLKDKLKISDQRTHPYANKGNGKTVNDTQEFEAKYNDL